MRLKAVPSTVKCSHCAYQALASSNSIALNPSPRSKNYKIDQPVSLIVLCNPLISKSQTLNKTLNRRTIRRSCSLGSDDTYQDEPLFHLESDRGNDRGHNRKRNTHCATPKNDYSPFTNKHERNQESFVHSRFDFLEPMMLGIKPDWPDQETVIRANIEQKAKSFDIPLSMRMIKKKLQSEEGFSLTEPKEPPTYCSVKAAFASMVFIIVELQSHALHLREALCREDLSVISSKVQKEMHLSFVWLFQQVFSKTPDLMLHVMVLLANFSVYSASHKVKLSGSQIHFHHQVDSSSGVEKKGKIVNLRESRQRSMGFHPSDLSELNLWDSMVDDAKNMREGAKDNEVLDYDVIRDFVSPVSVEVEPDNGYEDYLRTDLLYQMNLSKEPNNQLLLCNYAQFLYLIARDYNRAEECFKRAVQLLPVDAESLSQYANFLWLVRRDVSGAEEMFLQALSIEPDNSYYASRYASFLWSTGGEETCFTIDN
ncbi:hypothetical protein CASFOL_006648 [Castilleja foliolosa]|uniref:Tetratricopeptide repeat-like superfamily protein n=1 Tax=Castilleja foliolosa TaxID=1961234 RepID=A0ABD3EAV6_9LAMI